MTHPIQRTIGWVGTPPWRCYVALKVTSQRANSPSLFVIDSTNVCHVNLVLGICKKQTVDLTQQFIVRFRQGDSLDFQASEEWRGRLSDYSSIWSHHATYVSRIKLKLCNINVSFTSCSLIKYWISYEYNIWKNFLKFYSYN